MIAMAKAVWVLYLSAVIACLDVTSATMLRCMISKHVAPDEVGKLFSFAGALQVRDTL